MTSNDLTQYALRVLSIKYEVWRNNAIPVRGRAFIGRKGVPDIIGFNQKGKFVGFEVKVGKDKLRPEQIEFLEMLNKYGGEGYVIRTKEDVDNIIKKLN